MNSNFLLISSFTLVCYFSFVHGESSEHRTLTTSSSFHSSTSALKMDYKDDTESDDEDGPVRSRRKKKCPKVWDRWSKWSDCSVPCGIGKQTRWRHCVAGDCAPGEKEAQIKTCTMPPC